jgi:putative transcriptional regulator
MQNEHFQRTVVLLTEHTPEGTVGFVLNRLSPYRLADALPDFPEFDVPLYTGGPVEENTLHYIHCCKDMSEGDEEIASGVYWGGDFERLRLGVLTGLVTADDVRIFHGYSGWGADQLNSEMEINSWILAPSRRKFTFSPEIKTLWSDILTAMGGKYRLMANYPLHPSLN